MTVAIGARSSSTNATGPSTSSQPDGPPVQTESGEAPPTSVGGVLQDSVEPANIPKERGSPARDDERAKQLAAYGPVLRAPQQGHADKPADHRYDDAADGEQDQRGDLPPPWAASRKGAIRNGFDALGSGVRPAGTKRSVCASLASSGQTIAIPCGGADV